MGRMVGRGFTARLPLVAVAVAVLAIGWASLRSVFDLGVVGGWLVALLAPPCAVAAAVLAARAATAKPGHGTPAEDPVLRRFWRLVAVSCAVAGCGSLVDAVGNGSAAGDVVSLSGYLVAIVILMYGLLRLPVSADTRAARLALSLDLGVVLTAFVVYAWFGARQFGSDLLATTGSGLALYMLLALGAAGSVGIAKVTLAGAGTVHPGSIGILATNALFTTVLGGLGTAVADRLCTQLILPVYMLGVVLAAELQRRGEPVPDGQRRRPRRRYSRLPYLAVAAVDLLLLSAHVTGHRFASPLAFGSVIVTALVVVRQIVAFAENTRLLDRLDVTLSEVERQEHRLESLLRHSSDVITVIDVDGLVHYASPGVEVVLDRPVETVLGTPIIDLVHPDDLPRLREHFHRLLQGERVPPYQVRLGQRDGGWRWLEIISTNLLDDPDVRGIVNNGRDVTDNRRYQEELAYQAAHDELTGLANRTLFGRATDQVLAAGDPGRTAVALVDLDDIKTIIDRLGHTVGDALLKVVGQRLLAGVRPGDTVARLGGDEFAVLLRDVEPGDLLRHVHGLLDELAVPVHAHGHELLVRASVGVTRGAPGLDAGELLRRADVAMYVVKGTGGGRGAEFDAIMDERAQEHARLAADLSCAVQRGELHLRYQPIVSLPEGTITGLECLVRWVHPVRGPVSPAEFIPVAERTGLIVPLGAWILNQACRQAARWVAELGDRAPDRITVNVSARQLIEPDFAATMAGALAASGLSSDRLVMEITETAVFNGGPALETVQAVRALGVLVALDDFGTGHSSLGLLRTCPVDMLKVDKSFVDGVAVSLEQEAIVTSISQIGTAMRLQVVAEGVETAEQAERLHTLGYRYAQGFHFARPLTPDELAERLAPAVAT
jgi:diguanylate cyclase (GGDEF)-like protein/PAS domain S-box-containing protein